MITAAEAKKLTDDAIDQHEASVSEYIFGQIADAASKREYSVDIGREPTNAERALLAKLGYRYRYRYWEGATYTVSWGAPTCWEKFLSYITLRVDDD